jgi:hypothetical protein
VLKDFDKVMPKIDKLANERAKVLQESYERLRKTIKGKQVSIEPMLPADVLSVSIIVPQPRDNQHPISKTEEAKPDNKLNSFIKESYAQKATNANLNKPLSYDYKVWIRLSDWVKETMMINTFWVDFALEISNKLQSGSKLSDKEKTDMKKCWEQAVKKGFR